MATQKIQIGVEVSDNGSSAKTQKNVKDLHSELKAAQQTAENIRVGGGTAGSRAVAARAQPQGSQTMTGQEYGSARGTAGITGASARDFANQAQGLGGLVRLYATFAANIFAVSAAFTALKNAADTTNLVKGLDTLGAASGRNLGTLSQRLVEITGGAISMREAMTATAQASSSGMSAKNIERLALVAKNASLALGVSMPDALSRLSRGIVKLEPELLDELGLFTKIGPATEKYALNIGKTASSLTDFERRQAFANAILEEGEKKFGALADAASNPYDTLLASLKNVLQSGLELVNKVLVPIINLLAQSPIALTGALAGIGFVLLKQALPAIGQVREGLKRTAEDSLKAAETFKSAFGDKFQAKLEERYKVPKLQEELKSLEYAGKKPASLQQLEAGTLDEKKLRNITDLLAAKNKLIESNKKGSRELSEVEVAAAKAQIVYIQKALEIYKAIRAEQSAADKPIGKLDPETLALDRYDKLRRKVASSNAISNAAENAQILGVRDAWAILNEEIADKGIKGFSKYTTLVQGGVSAIISRVTTLIGIASQIGQIITGVVVAFKFLDSALSTNSKQTELFNKAIKSVDDSVKNVSRTLEAAKDSEGIPSRTIESAVALSNAFTDLTDNAKEAIKTAKAAEDAEGLWDSFWDTVFFVVGRDRSTVLSKRIAEQISSSIELLSREGLDEEYSAAIKKILNVDNLSDLRAVGNAWRNLSEEQKKALQKLQDDAARALGNISTSLQSFKDAIEKGEKAYKTFANSFIDSSPAAQLGIAYLDIAKSINGIQAANPEQLAKAFGELATNTDKAALFGDKFIKAFAQIRNQAIEQADAVAKANEQIVQQQKLVEALGKTKLAFVELPAPAGDEIGPVGARLRNAPGVAAAAATVELNKLKAAAADLPRDAINAGINLLLEARQALLKNAADLINRAVAAAANAAAASMNRAIASNLTGPQRLAAETAIRREEIQFQLNNLRTSEAIIDSQSSLVNELKLANALQAEANILLKNPKDDSEELKQVRAEIFKLRGATGRENLPTASAALSAEQQKLIEDGKRIAQLERQVRTGSIREQQVRLQGELDVINFTKRQETPGLTTAQELELQKITDRRVAAERQISDIRSSISGVTNAELIRQKQIQELAQLKNVQEREILSIREDINKTLRSEEDLNKKLSTATSETRKSLQEQIDAQKNQRQFLENRLNLTIQAQNIERDIVVEKSKQELLNKELDQINKRYEVTAAQRDLESSRATRSLDYLSQEQQLSASIYGLSQKIVISRQAELDKQRAQNEARIASANIEAEIGRKRRESDTRIQALDPNAANFEQQRAEITGEQQRQQELASIAQQKIEEELNSRLKLIELSKALNLQQERYNLLLTNTQSVAESLKRVFGEVGAAIGSLGTILAEVSVQNDKNSKNLALNTRQQADERERLNRLAAEGPDDGSITKEQQESIQRINELQEQRTELIKKSQKDELAGNIKVIASAKTVFKEKTGAYKALDAMEKAMHTYKMLMFAQEVAMDLFKTGQAIANSLFRTTATKGEAAASGKAAIVEQGKGDPYTAFARMAAMAVFVASILGSSAKGASAPSFVLGAEQRQETQGTGMAYDAFGNLYETGGGVFGDPTAKLDSINKGIQTIKDNSIDGLFYDNRMLKALESIARSITGVAQSLYTTPGIRTGLNFGSLPGSSESGGGINFGGAALGAAAGTAAVAYAASGAAAGAMLGTAIAPVIGTAVGAIIGGLLGSKTTVNQSITDAGIQLRGSFQDIADAIDTSVMQYKEVLTTITTKRRFRSTKTSTTLSREVAAVNDEILASFSEVIRESKNLFITVADLAGVASTEVDRVFKETNTQLDISLLGLKGEEITTELNAAISSQLDILSELLFSSFDKFKKFGEGYTDTVIRVVSSNNKVVVALQAMGLATNNIAKNFEVTEAIIGEMALSLENFTEQASFFIDNFLTEIERTAITRQGVNQALTELSLPVTLTRNEFKTLVQSLDLTTVAGRDLYQSLQDLAPNFIKVTERLVDLEKETQNLAIELLRAQGETEKADKAFRDLATEGMIPAELAAYEYNESLRKQIEAAKQADNVTKQRISLEQRFYQVTANTAALRARELEALDETNRQLQLQIWSFEDFTKQLNDAKTALTTATQAIETAQNAITALRTTATDNYVAATQQVATAQQNVTNLVIEAAKRMRDFGKTIREFISQQLNPGATNTGNIFARTVELALSGNTEAIQEITNVAQQAIDSAKSTASSAAEFAQARAAILAKVSEVATFAETEAARTAIPLDDDPLIAANKALELAIIEQTKAQEVANAIGASLVKVPEDLVAKYTLANQDLATALANKFQSELAQAQAQAALDAIVANTAALVSGTGTSNQLQFARGGVFSNKIITGSTRFQMGEMGESGPEAIMPLMRARDGTLGVIAQPAPQGNLTDALIGQNLELVAEVRALREEVNLLRFEARATASSTNKTTRILERVTRDGESLITTDSATL